MENADPQRIADQIVSTMKLELKKFGDKFAKSDQNERGFHNTGQIIGFVLVYVTVLVLLLTAPPEADQFKSEQSYHFFLFSLGIMLTLFVCSIPLLLSAAGRTIGKKLDARRNKKFGVEGREYTLRKVLNWGTNNFADYWTDFRFLLEADDIKAEKEQVFIRQTAEIVAHIQAIKQQADDAVRLLRSSVEPPEENKDLSAASEPTNNNQLLKATDEPSWNILGLIFILKRH